MTRERKHLLDTFVFNDGLIFHEVGGPPLHTVNPKLREHLSDEKIGRLYAYHNSVDSIDVNLNIAEEGATLGLVNTPELPDEEAMLLLLSKSSFFNELPIEQKIEIAKMAKKHEVRQGEHIVVEGEEADDVYFIERGVFDIYSKKFGQSALARMTRFESFGEAGLKNMTRTASIFAQTDGILYSVKGTDLKKVVPEKSLNELLDKQLEHRPFIGTHNLFRSLPRKIQQVIANKSEKRLYAEKDVILNLGVESDGFSIIAEGEAEVLAPDENDELKHVASLQAAEFFGEMSLINRSKTSARVVASTPCTVYFIPRETFQKLIETNYQFSYLVTNIMKKRKTFNASRESLFQEDAS